MYSSAKKKNSKGNVEPVKIDKIVDKRRLYINAFGSLNRFKRVLFDDSDYFSFTDVLFVSQSFGERVRFQDYQYGEFFGSDIKTRETYTHQAFEQWANSSYKQKCHRLT